MHEEIALCDRLYTQHPLLYINFLFCSFRHVLSSLLPAISSAYANHHLHDGHLHSLITLLASWQDEYSNVDVCEMIFDHFLLTMVSQESVLRHTLRLLHFVHAKMDSNKVVAILTATTPSPEVCIFTNFAEQFTRSKIVCFGKSFLEIIIIKKGLQRDFSRQFFNMHE